MHRTRLNRLASELREVIGIAGHTGHNYDLSRAARALDEMDAIPPRGNIELEPAPPRRTLSTLAAGYTRFDDTPDLSEVPA